MVNPLHSIVAIQWATITEEKLEFIKITIEKEEEFLLEYTKYYGEATRRKIRFLEIDISNGRMYLKL